MTMIKRIFLILALLAVTAYLAFSVIWLAAPPQGRLCKGVQVVVVDSTEGGFVSVQGVREMIERLGECPLGKPLDSIRLYRIEQTLQKHPFIERAECYKSLSGYVCVDIHGRCPVMRVIDHLGSSYFIDKGGHIMPSGGGAAQLPVATGHITHEVATTVLYELALLLQNDDFWNNQIEQVNVTAEGELELVPRVGNHLINLGKPRAVEHKLERVKTFYEKVLNRVGWNRYAAINVEFDNQIICTRR